MHTKPPNVVVLVVDTLRLDRSESIAKALDGAVDYGWAVTPAPWTLPAHVSLLTGLYPSIHESHETPNTAFLTDFANLRNNKTTLMTRLKKLGYTTYGYSANSFISKAFGFDGFDVLKNWEVPWADLLFRLDKRSQDKWATFIRSQKAKDFLAFLIQLFRYRPRLMFSTIKASISVGLDRKLRKWPENKGLENIIRFVKRTKLKEPFFLFINILEVHEPYFKNDNLIKGGFAVRSTATIPKEELNLWVKGYDDQVDLTARKLSKLMDVFRKKPSFQNTLFALTSDHGQLLGEHGFIGHGVFLYDEIVKVPLFIKYPAGMKVHFTSTKEFINLTSIHNFLLDIVEGGGTDSSLFTPHVFSESWSQLDASHEGGGRAVSPSKTHGARVCVFSKEGKITYNLVSNEIEESQVNLDQSVQHVKESLVQKCIKFAELNEQLLSLIAPNQFSKDVNAV